MCSRGQRAYLLWLNCVWWITGLCTKECGLFGVRTPDIPCVGTTWATQTGEMSFHLWSLSHPVLRHKDRWGTGPFPPLPLGHHDYPVDLHKISLVFSTGTKAQDAIPWEGFQDKEVGGVGGAVFCVNDEIWDVITWKSCPVGLLGPSRDDSPRLNGEGEPLSFIRLEILFMGFR